MGVSVKFNMPSLTPKTMFRFLVIVFWTQKTFLNFVVEVVERFPIINNFSSYIIPVLFISLFALSLPYILQRVHIPDIIFALSIILVVIMTLLIYPESSEYISPQLWRIFGLSVPLYFVGVIYDHNETKADLFYFSILGVCVVFVYQLYVLATGRVLSEDNMNTSYNVLPSIMYLIYWAVTNKGIKNWIIALSASMVSFIFGTRGPIVSIFVFLAICLVYKIFTLKNVLIRILLTLLLALIIVFIISGDNVLILAKSMSEKFEQIGFSTRIFDFLIDEQLNYDSGRDALSGRVWEAIKQKPLTGYGFMGDRAIVSPYVHNIILEYLCSYGIIIGGIVTVLTLVVPVVAVIQMWNFKNYWFIVMLMCMVFVKLMVSGSYVYEPYFYLLIGLSVNAIRLKRNTENSI